MLICITALLLSAAAPAICWDGFGHQTVGFIAQKYFTHQANATVGALIGLGDAFDIGDAAAWADTIRDRDNLPWSKNWHFINPKGDDPENHVCVMDYPTDCVNQNCIIAAIMNQTSIVLDTTNPSMARRNATMFLLHFFGDLHQFFHITGFKFGGTAVRPVCWDTAAPCDSNRSLHGVWDSAIPRKLRGIPEETDRFEDKAGAKSWASDIYSRQKEQGISTNGICAELGGPDCILDWATESNKLVCSHGLKNGEAWILNHDLSKEYFDENGKLADTQVGKAGLRLAAWMNAIASTLGPEKGNDL
ncbi:S1/P1 nuclease [Lasiosphaeria hispida]|uniref:S1/P1 nuclease n=1 Tax=Lasiosphaeria hispida TaxID=260671 RepID=A0AAJ0HKI6_9PEZI|nr:S1/P1 nuclease [Lasiosphaeria hispida]